MKSRTAIAAVSVLAAVSLVLRLYRLNDGLWLDEISTWIRYMRLPLLDIPRTYGSENQHFLFSLLARISMNVFGESVWAFRLPAVLFGSASVWAAYLFAAEAASRQAALFTAALLTFSYHHIWFSQNARGYSGLLFWTLLASYFLLRALRDDRRLLWLAYAAAAALGVYTHATMAFVLLSHAVLAAWNRRTSGRWSGALLGFLLGALLTVLLHAPAIPAILDGLHATVSVVEEWRSPLWTVLELAQGLRVSFAGAVAALAAVALFLLGARAFLREKPIVLGLLFLPPLLGSAILLSRGHHIWPRFFYFAFGFAALVLIRGALDIHRLVPRFGPRAASVLAALLVAFSAASVPFAYGPKQDFDSALAFISANRRSGDVVASADLATWVYHGFYRAPFVDIRSAAQLRSLSAQPSRVWLVYTLDPVFRAQLPELYAAVRRDFRTVRAFPGTLRSGEVTVCVKEMRP